MIWHIICPCLCFAVLVLVLLVFGGQDADDLALQGSYAHRDTALVAAFPETA